MMHVLQYRVETLSPVLITSTSDDGNMVAAAEHITGTSILGMFAGKFITINEICPEKAHENERFYRWFLQGALKFGNAYLSRQRQDKSIIKFIPAPLFMHCKKNDPDTAYNLIKMKELDENTKAVRGYVSVNGERYYRDRPDKALHVHHSRKNRTRGHSEEGQIFNYEALAEGQVFDGSIFGDEAELLAFCNVFGNENIGVLGRSRQAQYGKVRLQLGEIEAVGADITPDENTVILTLESPLILVNEYGYPELSVGLLVRYLQDRLVPDTNVTVEKAYARTETVENFVGVWKAKRPQQKAFSAGSSFKLTFSSAPETEIKRKLEQLQAEGIGERRHEGFGQVRLWWPEAEYFILDKIDKSAKEKPGGVMPDLARTVFAHIVEVSLLRQVDSEAFRLNEDIKRNGLNGHIIGKLEMMLVRPEQDMFEPSTFSKKINGLRKTAQDKLKNTRFVHTTLFEELSAGSFNRIEIIINNLPGDVRKLAVETGFDLEDVERKKELYRCFWLTFLRRARKDLKNDPKEGGEVLDGI